MAVTCRGSSPVLRGMIVYVMSLEELACTETCCLWGPLNATLHMSSVLSRITSTCKQTVGSGHRDVRLEVWRLLDDGVNLTSSFEFL